MVQSLKTIDRAASRCWASLSQEPETILEAIRKQAFISAVGSTTRIENAILTDIEIEQLDTRLIQTRPADVRTVLNSEFLKASGKGKVQRTDLERSLEEVAGSRELLREILEGPTSLYPLSQSNIRGMHQVLLKYHPPAQHYAGRYKTHSNSVIERHPQTGMERVVLNASEPGPVTEAAMRDLTDWYNQIVKRGPWPLLIACEFVLRFLICHPFEDGNGRLSRALFLLTLMHTEDSVLTNLLPYLALDRAIERRRARYYHVLAQAGGAYAADPKEYHYVPFVQFMLACFLQAIEGVEMIRQRVYAIQNLPPAAQVVLACFKESPQTRLRPKMIVAQTRLPRRTVTDALRRLTAIKVLQKYGQGAGTNYQWIF